MYIDIDLYKRFNFLIFLINDIQHTIKIDIF